MIFTDTWAKLILSGAKKLEIRSCRYKEGSYWIGVKGNIKGKCTLENPTQIKDILTWKKLQHLHCCKADGLPYKKTWAFHISNVEAVSPEIRYLHPRGAIGIVRFRGL